jgi:hypothetical protein
VSEDPSSEDGGIEERLPGKWVVWNDEAGGPATWVFEPTVFDAETFPAACIPTIHVTNRQSDRRPPGRGSGSWRAKLTLEPEIEVDRSDACPTRTVALERARDLARRFSAGKYDVRGAYNDPSDRELYLERLSQAIEGTHAGTED